MTRKSFEKFYNVVKHGDSITVNYAGHNSIGGTFKDSGLDNSIIVVVGTNTHKHDVLIGIKSIESILLEKEGRYYE